MNNTSLYIRRAVATDLPRLMEIYSTARAFMRTRGNHAQWTGGYPSIAIIEEGIARGEQWVVCMDNADIRLSQQIVATFWFSTAPEPTYERIFDGEWLSDGAFYGVVHRLASDGSVSGVGALALRWCLARCGDLRVDTHRDNSVMQSLLRREGFVVCGTIFLADGSARDAFERVLSTKEAKKMIRDQVRDQLLALTLVEAQERTQFCSQAEALQCVRYNGSQNVGTVALFCALPNEPSMDILLDKLLGVTRLALPAVTSHPGSAPEMEFREYTGPECLRRGRFGILEPFGTPAVPPEDIDFMFVPGVAFTADNQRLGRGGGFYDRYFSDPAAANIHKVGVCSPGALVEWIPIEPHDVKMNEIVIVQ